jgi:hypothetical protein
MKVVKRVLTHSTPLAVVEVEEKSVAVEEAPNYNFL